MIQAIGRFFASLLVLACIVFAAACFVYAQMVHDSTRQAASIGFGVLALCWAFVVRPRRRKM